MLIKKIKMKFISIVLLLLMSLGSFAHTPELSTLVLSKTDNGKYVLQVTSSLTAFEGEVDYLFGKDSYKTPEEFRELVIIHFRKNISFIVNGKALEFVKPEVILGHETKLVVEVTGIPSQINTIDLKSTMFKDMSRNQSVVMLVGNEFPNKQYILDNENSQYIRLESKNGNWDSIMQTASVFNAQNAYYLLWLLIIPVVYLLVVQIKRKQLKLA